MKCILLCAGYATRMYPLTENFPKPLLEIKGKALIDYLIEDLEYNNLIDEYVIVSNHKFINHFNNWKNKHVIKNITILDDGSISNETRLGAVNDIWFAIENATINDDILVLAGDNILDFSLKSFVEFSNKHKSNAVMCYYETENSRLQRTGVAVIDENGKILEMTEKPKNPKSNWAIPPFYIFKNRSLQEIKKGIDSGCKTDAPGSFIEWFCKRNEVYAYEMPGKRIDIGNLDDYYKIK
mgnify:CR=1 FL=1